MNSVSLPSSSNHEVPTSTVDDFSNDVPLVTVTRGAYVNSVHRGIGVMVQPDGYQILSVGDVEQPVFLRSAAKPFQVLPAVLAGSLDRFGITLEELAVLCASHAGEPRHVRAVRSVLDKIGMDESALRCGVHRPIDQQSADDLVRQGRPPTASYNNCSGAHAGMLVACVANGWTVSDYGDPMHPLQVEIRQILSLFTDLPAAAVEFAVDNCAVPTFYLPLRAAALAFARLARPEGLPGDVRAGAATVRTAMTSFPIMVGGEQSFDSQFMEATEGQFVAKGGADAFHGSAEVQSGRGLVVKISDGNSRAVAPTVLSLWLEAGALRAPLPPTLDAWLTPDLQDLLGHRVGRIQPLFGTAGH